MRKASEYALGLANGLPGKAERKRRSAAERRAFLAHSLAVAGGAEPKAWLELLVALSMAADAPAKLREMNPYLRAEEAERILDDGRDDAHRRPHRPDDAPPRRRRAVARARHAREPGGRRHDRRRPHAEERQEGLQTQLCAQADLLAGALAQRRHFVRTTKAPGLWSEASVAYDPRLLGFEFISGFVLREQQVSLVQAFMGAVGAGRSQVHQMIMGGGKTTVIAPLLALLLADGDRLVVQCVPAALLEMSRAVMRAVFSTVVVRGVYTLHFDRLSTADHTARLREKLLKARDTKAIVVCQPTSIKAFLLKLVQCFHLLSLSRSADDAESVGGAIASAFGNLTRGLKRAVGGHDAHAEQVAALREQAERCVEVYQLFQSSALLLDEVDLCLHPLKAELNWPLGDKLALDFTQGERQGLRWRIPFFLLDGIFYVVAGTPAERAAQGLPPAVLTSGLDENPRARDVLAALRAAVRRGVAAQALQLTEGFAQLLSKPWYRTELAPLLADWLVILLVQLRIPPPPRGVSDAQMKAYLLRREVPSDGALDRLSDEKMQMLNLSADWLTCFLPHVLTRVARVHYGLLQPEELARALAANPCMPKNRKHLAVPFVGKDVPSKASEFSHPDVVIGLTIAAYRLEGLRRSDLKEVLRTLRQDMAEQSGPYKQRPACQTFVRWVELAGKRVRGTRRPPASAERQAEAAIAVQRIVRGNTARRLHGTEGLADRVNKARRWRARMAVTWKPVGDAFGKLGSAMGDALKGMCSGPAEDRVDDDDELPMIELHAMKTRGEVAPPKVAFADELGHLKSARLRLERVDVLEPAAPLESEEDVWPLQLLDLGDETQQEALHALLCRVPHVVQYHTDDVFVETMEFQEVKLAASGQDLGGDILLPLCLGFSGTPSNLLPRELGACQFAKGDEARMVDTLTTPAVVTVRTLPDDWGVNYLSTPSPPTRRATTA